MGKESKESGGPRVTPRNRLAQLLIGKTTEEGGPGGRSITHTPGLVQLGHGLYRVDRAVGAAAAELAEAALRKGKEWADKAEGRAPSDPSAKGQESGQPGHTGKFETGEGGEVSRTYPRGTEVGSGGVDPKAPLYVGPDGTVSNEPSGTELSTVGKIFALFAKGGESLPPSREPESRPRDVPMSPPSHVTNYPGYHYHGTVDPETGKPSGYRDPMVAPQTAESPQQPQPEVEPEDGSHPDTTAQGNPTVPTSETHEPAPEVDNPTMGSEPGIGDQGSASAPDPSHDTPVTPEVEHREPELADPTERLPQQSTSPETLPDDAGNSAPATTPSNAGDSSAAGGAHANEKSYPQEHLPSDEPAPAPVPGELFPVEPEETSTPPAQEPKPAVPGELFPVAADVAEPEPPAEQPDLPDADLPPVEPPAPEPPIEP